MDSTIECQCGSKQYGYYSGTTVVYVCFKCGKFACFGGTKQLYEIFTTDTNVILNLIEEGTLKRIDNLNTSDYK
jgi:DNA-directed RNA polymerase subunit RPC12/RpoP